MGSGEEDAVDTLRLTDSEWLSYVAELDREASRHMPNEDGRQHERMPYRNVAYVTATLKHLDGRHQKFIIRTHDLSESGLGFLHGNFIYPGSPMRVILHHRVHGLSYHDTIVRRCAHYKRHIHQVGVEFEKPINIEDYILTERLNDTPAAG